MRGQPQLGLRRLNSTTAVMISGLGPLGPGFPRSFGEKSNLYFPFLLLPLSSLLPLSPLLPLELLSSFRDDRTPATAQAAVAGMTKGLSRG